MVYSVQGVLVSPLLARREKRRLDSCPHSGPAPRARALGAHFSIRIVLATPTRSGV